MKLPERYNDARTSMPSDEVSYGCGGIKLFSDDELEDGQLGYSISPDGSSLCSGEAGAWQPNWVVIGYETALAGPISVDIDVTALPVFTAMHGEGAWDLFKSLRRSRRSRSALSLPQIPPSTPLLVPLPHLPD